MTIMVLYNIAKKNTDLAILHVFKSEFIFEYTVHAYTMRYIISFGSYF